MSVIDVFENVCYRWFMKCLLLMFLRVCVIDGYKVSVIDVFVSVCYRWFQSVCY